MVIASGGGGALVLVSPRFSAIACWKDCAAFSQIPYLCRVSGSFLLTLVCFAELGLDPEAAALMSGLRGQTVAVTPGVVGSASLCRRGSLGVGGGRKGCGRGWLGEVIGRLDGRGWPSPREDRP